MAAVHDRHNRPLRNLRLSVTDRCNLRCSYCMPEQDYVWLAQKHILHFEEITRLVGAFHHLGVDRLRITGGEPLLRRELDVLVAMLASKYNLQDLAMTTNAVLLDKHAEALRKAGLHRITVSLDTLDRETFRMLARRDDLGRVLDGIAAARAAGFAQLKLDTVVIAGVNDNELPALVEFARDQEAEIRFIEYMDVGGATRWRPESVVTRAQMLEELRQHFGPIEALPRTDSAPAERFRLSCGTTFGIIASVSEPFCATCDRSRLTADGMWFRCLYAREGSDLRRLVRSGIDDAELAAEIAAQWQLRTDRGAEQRLGLRQRSALAGHDSLKNNPHLEMHTRGG